MPKTSFARKLRELRCKAGMSIEQLAKEIGVRPYTIDDIECGQLPSKETLDKYNRFFCTKLKRYGTCKACGKRFEMYRGNTKYCPLCRDNGAYTQKGRIEIDRKKRKKKVVPVDEMERRAREAGMSYGEYVRKVEG